MTTSERWILSEWRVARDRTENFGERLLGHREKTPYAEIDLYVRGEIYDSIIEVKTLAASDWAASIITTQQQSRLERARQYMETRTGRTVRLWLATVERNGAITYLEFPL